ncbi:hypothetical protein DEU56DRAFT_216184 [Suillus clintonianus]|uniref:uncharacterized protein n=1 Tax=Suillus clintonianus TaxID=1904413 RepID=UPI001B87A098|nr:uncharacterized protein DEU56DRAFT_216184 [Suillus clintonianus]KAG2111101.1 hypothetical protein DEU56DRAFT_216184 [Suillus clintonianus]
MDQIVIGSWDGSSSLPIPLDILLDVLQHLPVQSILALRQTSKSFYAITRLRSLWALLLRTHVQEQNLPMPHLDGKSLDCLSALELEQLTCYAFALRSNWTNPNPDAKREAEFYKPIEPDSRIVFMEFLPGRGNRWLISVTMTAQPRKYVIQCWNVAIPQPVCVAELTHMEGPYGGIVINDDPSSPAIIVMQSALTEILTIDFEEEDPESAFVPLSTIDGIREIHLLSGNTLVTRRPGDSGEVSIWDINDQPREKIQLVNPSLLQNDRCQAMHLRDDYMVIIRQQTIEFYSTVPRPNIIATPGAPISYPLAQHSFQWRADTVNMSEQVSWHAARSHRPSPINVVIRFGSIYPWPVNVLHHFVITPNPAYVPGRETSLYNLPYLAQPTPMKTIGSPVRLFAPSSVALGRYGTAIWLDSHTEDWMGPSDCGQRLAGHMMTTEESLNRPHGSHASMIFRVRDDDLWCKVAVDEESGRIAVGDVNGSITLFEYS